MIESQLDDGWMQSSPIPLSPIECRPEQLLPTQVDFARRIFEKFLGQLRALLPGYLYTPVEIRCGSPAQQALSEALSEDPGGGCTVLLDLSPFPGKARLMFGSHFSRSVLEILLGAPPDAPVAPAEETSAICVPLTGMDLQILQGLLDLAVAELGEAWRPACGASFQAVSTDPSESAPTEPDDPSVLVLPADIKLRGGADMLRLLVPSLLVRLASRTATGAAPAPAPTGRNELLDALGSASCEVEAVLHGADIRLRDLMELKPGQVLALPCKIDTPIELQVNGVVKLQGELVNSGQSVGLQIDSWVEPGYPGGKGRPAD